MVCIHFKNETLTQGQYEAVKADLEAMGAFPNPDMLSHTCFGNANSLEVFEVWTSPEAMEAFGERLRPLLEKHGVGPGVPRVLPVVAHAT